MRVETKRLLLAVLAMGAVAGVPAEGSAEEPSWAGTWKVVFVNAKGEDLALHSPVFVLKQDGSKVTGTWKDTVFKGTVDGAVSGNRLKAKTTSSGPQPRFALDVKLSPDGTKFSGVWLDGEGNKAGEAVVSGTRAE